MFRHQICPISWFPYSSHPLCFPLTWDHGAHFVNLQICFPSSLSYCLSFSLSLLGMHSGATVHLKQHPTLWAWHQVPLLSNLQLEVQAHSKHYTSLYIHYISALFFFKKYCFLNFLSASLSQCVCPKLYLCLGYPSSSWSFLLKLCFSTRVCDILRAVTTSSVLYRPWILGIFYWDFLTTLSLFYLMVLSHTSFKRKRCIYFYS